MKTKLNLMLLSFVISINLSSQTWQKTLRDGNFDDNAYCITKTLDSCYLIGGSSYDITNNNILPELYKIDKNGNLIWSKTYSDGNFIYSIVENPDSTLLISGEFLDGTSIRPGGIFKLTKNGLIIYSLKNTSEKIIRTFSGDIFNCGGGYCAINKITNNGSVLFEKITPSNISIDYVAQLTDGNFIGIGAGNFNLSGFNTGVIMKLNSNGDTLWTKKGGSRFNSVYAINSGGFMVTDGTSIYKFDNNGIQIFSTYINYSVTISKIIDALDGGSYIGGTINGQGAGGDDFFLMKINASGTALWTKSYGSILNEQLSDIILGFNNNIVLVGNTNGFSSINNDVYIVTTDLNGNTNCNQTNCTLPIITNPVFQFSPVYGQAITTQSIITNLIANSNSNNPSSNTICLGTSLNELKVESNNIFISPNPAKNNVSISFYSFDSIEKIEFYNINGACVLTENIISNYGFTKTNVNISNLIPSIYFVRIGTKTTKIVVE